MNCQNCKNWVFGRCNVSNLVVGPDMLCNAWELSQSHEHVNVPYSTFDAKLIAELEAENDRLQDAWFHDETICPDGSLRPKVSTLLERISELEKSNELHRNINRDVATALGLKSGDSWHNLPERVIDLRKRNDELEALIDQLIEAGRAVTSVAEWRYANLTELLAWDTLVDKIYKEREKWINPSNQKIGCKNE